MYKQDGCGNHSDWFPVEGRLPFLNGTVLCFMIIKVTPANPWVGRRGPRAMVFRKVGSRALPIFFPLWLKIQYAINRGMIHVGTFNFEVFKKILVCDVFCQYHISKVCQPDYFICFWRPKDWPINLSAHEACVWEVTMLHGQVYNKMFILHGHL